MIFRSKRGTERWTTAKLIKWVLLILLLVLIVWGSITNGLNPLYEKVGGRIDEVLVFIGLRSSNTEPGCSQGVDEEASVSDTNGTVKVCDDGCSYILIDPEEYLDYTEFSIGEGGMRVTNENVSYPFTALFGGYDISTYSEDYGLDKGSYDEVLEFIDSFEPPEDNGTKEEFLEILEFSPNAYFTITMRHRRGSFSGRKPDIVYYWDGERWIGEEDDLVYQNIAELVSEGVMSEEDATKSLMSSISTYHGINWDIYWNYAGDGRLNTIMGDFNINFQNVEVDEKEFTDWLRVKMGEVDSGEDDFFITIEDRGINTVFRYGGRWKKRRNWGMGYKDSSEEEAIGTVMDANGQEILVTWSTKDDDEEMILMTEEEAVLPDQDLPRKFTDWIEEMAANYTYKKEKQTELMGEFIKYVDSSSGRSEIDATLQDVDGRDKVFVYIESEDENSYKVKRGAYRENGNFVFARVSDDFNEEWVNEDADWVYLSDDDFSEFSKVDEIFKFLYERCGR